MYIHMDVGSGGPLESFIQALLSFYRAATSEYTVSFVKTRLKDRDSESFEKRTGKPVQSRRRTQANSPARHTPL